MLNNLAVAVASHAFAEGEGRILCEAQLLAELAASSGFSPRASFAAEPCCARRSYGGSFAA